MNSLGTYQPTSAKHWRTKIKQKSFPCSWDCDDIFNEPRWGSASSSIPKVSSTGVHTALLTNGNRADGLDGVSAKTCTESKPHLDSSVHRKRWPAHFHGFLSSRPTLNSLRWTFSTHYVILINLYIVVSTDDFVMNTIPISNFLLLESCDRFNVQPNVVSVAHKSTWCTYKVPSRAVWYRRLILHIVKHVVTHSAVTTQCQAATLSTAGPALL